MLTAAILCAAVLGGVIIGIGPADASGTVPTTTVDAQAVPPVAGNYYGSVMPSIVKVFGALAVVIACIYGGVYLFKRSLGRKFSGNSRSSALEVLETTHIGPKRVITLLRVNDRAVLIGSTESQVALLTELSSEETAELLAQSKQEPAQADFAKMFGSTLAKLRSALHPIGRQTAGVDQAG